MFYDGELKNLHKQVLHKKKLECSLQDLLQQRKELLQKKSELEKIKKKEQSDVDKLEKITWSSVFYQMIGKKEEKLDKERKEAYEALLKYNMGMQELDYVESSLRQTKEELEHLADCERKFEYLLNEKLIYVKQFPNAESKKIFALEQQIVETKNKRKELDEAIKEGETVLNGIMELFGVLENAENYGVWDTLGGGLLADLAKYDELDTAQKMVERLQRELRAFKVELADIAMDIKIDLNMDDFTRFGDCLFDNIFTDYNVLEKIRIAMTDADKLRGQVETLLHNLYKQKKIAEEELEDIKQQFEHSVVALNI